MTEIKNIYGSPIDRQFEPFLIKDTYWIFDTKLNQFVRIYGSWKCVWAQAWHAKTAFANTTKMRIEEQTRYEVTRIQ